MAENTREFPPKAVMRKSITTTQKEKTANDRNSHSDVKYQGKPWLIGKFGPKDGTADKRYYLLKAQIAALSSAIYRMAVYKGSPAYFALYDETKPYGHFGFITKTIRDKLEGNDLLWAIKEMLDRKKYQYRGEPRKRSQNQADVLEDLKISIILRNTAVQFLKLLYFGREDDVSGENRVNGKKMPELINMLQYPVFSGSLEDLKEENIGHLKLILSRFDTFFYEFVSKLKKSYKLQETIEACFAESGLPELMAVSYFLGEFVFKPYDILFDEKYQRLRRIDHERNLWPMVRKFLGQVDPKNDKFPPNAKTARQLGLYAVDIQNFPDSFTSDKNASCKKWFHEYPYLDNSLNSKKARHKAYTTWLFLALVPDYVYIAFSKAHMSAKTFEPEARRMLLDRKAGLKNCLNDSPKFIKFLQNVQCDALDSLINHHNQKNPDCPLNKAELSEALRAWQVASRILKPKSTYEYQTEVGEIRFPRRKPGSGEEPVKPNLLS